MTKQNLTETERSLITMALRDKCNCDTELARIATDPRLADQFKRQALMAAALADQIDNAEAVAVTPYQPDDGENDEWGRSGAPSDRERFNCRQ